MKFMKKKHCRPLISRVVIESARPILFLLLLALTGGVLPVQAQNTDEPISATTGNLAEKPAAVIADGQTGTAVLNKEIKFPSVLKRPDPERKRFDFEPQKNVDKSQTETKDEILPNAATSPEDGGKNPANQTNGGYVRPNAKERFKGYVSGVVGPYALLGTAAFAGIYHYRDLPREWEGNSKGYARRFASGLGINAVRETTVYALDEAFRLDSNFYKSKRKKISERLIDAVVSTYTARRPDGSRVFAFPRIAGNYAAMTVAYKTWYPERFGYKNALRDATFSIGYDVGINIFREFFPWGK